MQLSCQAADGAEGMFWVVAGAGDYVTETWRSGDSWYRKWKSGWLEQGGFINYGTANFTLNFHTPFANTNYIIVGTRHLDENTGFGFAPVFIRARISGSVARISTLEAMFWRAEGQGA